MHFTIQYRLECADDGSYTNKTVNSKSWFYFQVSGFPKNTKGKFYISRLQALSSIYYVSELSSSLSMPSAIGLSTESMASIGNAWSMKFL